MRLFEYREGQSSNMKLRDGRDKEEMLGPSGACLCSLVSVT